jgi:hypothetical protein
VGTERTHKTRPAPAHTTPETGRGARHRGPIPPSLLAVQSRLGDGRAIDTSVRSRMEPIFQQDFSSVRLHTDATAATLAGGLDARAFTVGDHVAFGAGHYHPGTVVGDALIAHELAHVVQQRAGLSRGPAPAAGGGDSALERDADSAAAGAVATLWGNARSALAEIGQSALPRQHSGLRLSRCNGASGPGPQKSVTVNHTKLHGATGSIDSAITFSNNKVYNQANVEVKKGTDVTLDETKSKAILGADLILHEFTDPTKPTAEEQALLKINQTSGAVTMYYVKALSDGHTGEAFIPSNGVGVGFVVANSGIEQTFAHELGHVLLDSGSHVVPDDTYLMHPSIGAGKTKLTPDQIKTIRSSPYVT